MNAPFEPHAATARQDRSRIEGRTAFVIAALLMATGLVALVDVAGAPARVVAALGPTLSLAGLATIGLLAQTMRVSGYFAGARAAPGAYAGVAGAGAAAGLALPFLPPLTGGAGLPSPMALGVGFLAGLAGAALLAGPLLRKSGAYTLADLAAGRFASAPVRVCAALACAMASAALAVVGLHMGAFALSQLLGLSQGDALLACGLATLAMTLPGGLSGATWSGAAAGGAFAAGAFAPLLALLAGGESAPAPFLDAAAWSAASARIAGWSGAGATGAADMALAATLALGLATAAPLMGPAIATGGSTSARRAGASLLVWIALVALAVAAAMAVSTLALDELLVGRRPQALAPSAYAASAQGLLTLCGATPATPAAAAQACREAGVTGALGSGDVWASGLYLLAAAPELRGMSVALSGLLAAGLAAICLALASAGAHAFAAACAHDILFRACGSRALTSRRLANARLCALLLIAGVVFISARVAPDPRVLAAFACALSAATLTPVLLLALWPHASRAGALAALLAGAATMAAAALIATQSGADALRALGAGGLAGFLAALAAGVALSRRADAQDAREGRIFAAGLLHGSGDLLNRDDAA